MKHIAFPSIEQFRSIVHTIKSRASYTGPDVNGDPTYDPSLPMPVIEFTGTVKLHGTNAGVAFNENDGLWFQARSNIITPGSGEIFEVKFSNDTKRAFTIEDGIRLGVDTLKNEDTFLDRIVSSVKRTKIADNAGFAFFANGEREWFISSIRQLAADNNIDLTKQTIAMYGEWVGPGIQKGVGISLIPNKAFFIFGVKVVNEDNPKDSATWLDYKNVSKPEGRIYNILDYPTLKMSIDMARPELMQNAIIEQTIAIEDECPVSKAFGLDATVGEGLVFTGMFKGERYIFKSKGEKHASGSKPKTLNPVDDEKIRTLVDLADKVTPTWRLDQMLTETFDLINGGQLDRKRLGDYLKAVINDVVKEDSDIISGAGFELKDVAKYISEIAKKFYFEQERLTIGV
jgi:RNA ligase